MKLGKSFLNNAFFWFFVLLLAGELTAYAVLPYRTYPSAGEVYRNPTSKRAWPEFVRGGASSDKRLIIFISNSQAIGKEMHDAEKIYFALLKKAIEKKYPSVSIENWSSGGIRTVDLDLLTLRAAERKADLVVFVMTFGNFDEPSKLNLDFPQSDIDLLAGRPSVWPHLKDTVFYPNTTIHDIVRRYFMLESSLLRSRIDTLDSLALRIPNKSHKYIFGHYINPGTRLDAFSSGGPIALPKKKDYLITGDNLTNIRTDMKIEEIKDRLETFRSFYLNNNRRFYDNDIRSIWVWMPIAPDVFTEEAVNSIELFNREASSIIRESGEDAFDLTWSIPTERFFTRSHLDEKGHELMADLMFNVIQNELQ